MWFEKLKTTLAGLGYIPTKSDNSLFTKFNKNIIVYVLIHVVDFIVTGNNGEEICNLINQLNQEFFVKDLGNLNYFLGIKVKRLSSSSILLNQKKYIVEILNKARMNQAKSISTPMVGNLHVSKFIGEAIPNDQKTEAW